jgi:hypothetical protein
MINLLVILAVLNFLPSGGTERWIVMPEGDGRIVLNACCKGSNARGYDGISANINAKRCYSYKIEFEVMMSSGYCFTNIGGYDNGKIINKSGKYKQWLEITDPRSSKNGELYFMGSNDFIGKIEILRIQEYIDTENAYLNDIYVSPSYKF